MSLNFSKKEMNLIKEALESYKETLNTVARITGDIHYSKKANDIQNLWYDVAGEALINNQMKD